MFTGTTVGVRTEQRFGRPHRSNDVISPEPGAGKLTSAAI